MANPWDFLSKWAADHVQTVAVFDAPDSLASHLAEQRLRDARAAGFKEDAVVKAAGGDLQGFMLAELETAANAELRHQVDRDRS
jgi:hypothetical protein